MREVIPTMRSRGRAALLVAPVLVLAACAPLAMYREIVRSGSQGEPLEVGSYRVPPPRAQAELRAGAAAADLTPPPGYPTGGHGPAGAVARGYWMRLKARAFFFEDRAGRALAIVSADLFAIPAGLKAEVARRAASALSREGLSVSLAPEALVLSATHTHQGPGNFMTSRIYNQFGSSYGGFAPELFDFLAEQIAQAVVGAARDARAHGQPVEIAVYTTRADYGLLRSRGPRTFTLNRDRADLLAAWNGAEPEPTCVPGPGEPPDDWAELPGCPRLRAIDRSLTALTVRRLSGPDTLPFAVLLFFAAHPTVLNADTPFYSPDFAGYATARLEEELGVPGRSVVAGFFNGAEGDVVTRRTRRDLRDVGLVGDAFLALVTQALSGPPLRVLHDPEVHLQAGAFRPSEASEALCGEARLSKAPTMGAPALGGAEDDRTVLHDLGWREGVRDRPTLDQGVKVPALDSQLVRALRFTEQFGPPEAYPSRIPLTLASLGDLRLAAVPNELTSAQGAALRRALGDLPHGELEIVGLANEYLSYCSSADEYTAQDYMGASTLFGPAEGSWLECRLAGLASGSELVFAGEVGAERYWPGVRPSQPFGPAFTGDLDRPDDGLEKAVRDLAGLPERHLPWFEWTEPASPPHHPLSAPRRHVVIWQRGSGGWQPLRPQPGGGAEDDLGPAILTVYLGSGRWSALWLRGLAQAPGAAFAFAVKTEDGRNLCSEPFPPLPPTSRRDSIPNGDCLALGIAPLADATLR